MMEISRTLRKNLIAVTKVFAAGPIVIAITGLIVISFIFAIAGRL